MSLRRNGLDGLVERRGLNDRGLVVDDGALLEELGDVHLLELVFEALALEAVGEHVMQNGHALATVFAACEDSGRRANVGRLRALAATNGHTRVREAGPILARSGGPLSHRPSSTRKRFAPEVCSTSGAWSVTSIARDRRRRSRRLGS